MSEKDNQTQTQTNCCSESKYLKLVFKIALALFLGISLAGTIASFIFIKAYWNNTDLSNSLEFCIAIIVSYTIIFCVLLICATYLAIHYMNHRYHCIQETQKLKRRKELFGQNDQTSAPSESSEGSDGDTTAEQPRSVRKKR